MNKEIRKGRPKTSVCPRCGIREKKPGSYYCEECLRHYHRAAYLKKKARMLEGGKKFCPCCGSVIDRRGMYCSRCAKLDPSKRKKAVAERERAIAGGKRFAALLRETKKIDWPRMKRMGYISKTKETAAPPKPELTLGDVMSEDGIKLML